MRGSDLLRLLAYLTLLGMLCTTLALSVDSAVIQLHQVSP
jgi:hypothetical protein